MLTDSCCPIHLVTRFSVFIQVGGVEIRSGDLVMGDKDGVIVIPQENEDDLFEHLDAYINANAMSGNFGVVSDPFPRIGRLCATPHAPCDLRYQQRGKPNLCSTYWVLIRACDPM